MIYLYRSTTNEQGFIYYFGIFNLKIGKFYTFFQLRKGPVMGPKISLGKSLCSRYLGHMTKMAATPIYGKNTSKICLANQSEILCGASMGRGDESLITKSRSHDQDGRHAHIW